MSYEYEPLPFTWRVIDDQGALVRTGPLASHQSVGPLLSYGQVVHPAGPPRWLTFHEFNNQPATNEAHHYWILRVPIWIGKHKDEMQIAWVTARCYDGHGRREILEEHEKIFQ